MPLIARQRSRLAVLAVLALVGSLLAVSAVPAVAAADDTADQKATYSACVGAAMEDAGFTDMGNSFAAGAANCLAHYGISSGTGDGSTFSPDRAVTRLQMARFLSRAAGPAGVDTEMVSAQGFTDISDLSEEAQDAVNTVAYLDIMTQRSDGTFDPAGIVTRRDMAVHLAAFLSAALVGPGGDDIDDLKNSRASGKSPFTDIGEVSVSAHKAIRDIFELGVTEGTTDTTFSPAKPVSRAQMAAFITRALAHTNARPAGLSVQADDTDVFEGDVVKFAASIRDNSNQPLADKSVDFFYLEGDDDEPFAKDGTCTKDVLPLEGSGECEIDASDLTTNSHGNLDVLVSHDVDDDTTVWAWTGDLGDDFDEDTTDPVTIDISAAAAPANTRVTVSAATGTVPFGDTVTFTFQVVDEDGNKVAKKGASVRVSSDIEVSADPDGDGANRSTGHTDTYMTDASGEIELSFTQSDPDDDKDSDDEATLDLTVTVPTKDGVGDLVDDKGGDHDGRIMVTWDDDKAIATALKLSSSTSYHEASAEGKGAGNTVRATLTDQYGDPVSGAAVEFDSNDADGAPDIRRHTNSRGVASLGYQRDSAADGVETIDATHTLEDGSVVNAESLKHYWAVESDTTGSGDVRVVDVADNTVVVHDGSDVVFVEYDRNDQFTVEDNRVKDTIGDGAKVLADFEKALGLDLGKADLSLAWTIGLDADGDRDAARVSTFTLTIEDAGATIPPDTTTPTTMPDTTTPTTMPDTTPTFYAESNGLTEITLTFDEDVMLVGESTSVPFVVKSGTGDDEATLTISAPTAVGKVVTLTLDVALTTAQKDAGVTVSYSLDTSTSAGVTTTQAGVTDSSGNAVASFTADVMFDTTPPSKPSSAESNGLTEITLTFDEDVMLVGESTSVPFVVKSGTGDDEATLTISAPTAVGKVVTLTLDVALTTAQKDAGVTVSYSLDTSTSAGVTTTQAGVTDSSGNAVASFTADVMFDTTPPSKPSSAESNGLTEITLTFDEDVMLVGESTSVPFVVKSGTGDDEATLTISAPTAVGKVVTLTLDVALTTAQKDAGVTVSYSLDTSTSAGVTTTQAGVTDSSGNAVASFTADVMFDTTPPSKPSSAESNGLTEITLTFDEDVMLVGESTSVPFVVKSGTGDDEATLTISAPTAVGKVVTLTLDVALTTAQKDAGVTVSYSLDTSTSAGVTTTQAGVTDSSGNAVASFTADVMFDTTPPKLVNP